ncbi:MAG: non-canonical purine NTP pyrophosphatase, RdgB/HAM1 family [Actinobacteria bacterium RBG_19FT_COMBO_70_19]|nr:MAG: non-canonical purine NTP pyrophosphatase, RdgB/HAM1 family [Actinobacteria bacterium RBG_19FT_COMBO_70_19]
MAFPERLAIASRNPHKLREIQAICADWPLGWVTVETHEGPWPDVEEPHDAYLHNALEKAHAVAGALGIPALADDSGLEVDALGGAPGPRSARYAGQDATDADNRRQLLAALKGIPGSGRSARFRCVTAIAWPDGRELHAEGVCEGTLETRERGSGGFGYDPLFVPEGRDRTMAELDPAEKDRISHRGRALRALRDLVAAQG